MSLLVIGASRPWAEQWPRWAVDRIFSVDGGVRVCQTLAHRLHSIEAGRQPREAAKMRGRIRPLNSLWVPRASIPLRRSDTWSAVFSGVFSCGVES